MLLHRVIPHRPEAAPGRPGSPLYRSPAQGGGRLDNSDRYFVYYFSIESSGAIGEMFGRHPKWTDEMFANIEGDGGFYSLATYWLPDEIRLLDLNNAANLHARGMRPTQVVAPNRSATQGWVLAIFDERTSRGERRWDGVELWSRHLPTWRIVGYWGRKEPAVLNVEPLAMHHPAVVDAARSLGRNL
jgi:hypothetical protein